MLLQSHLRCSNDTQFPLFSNRYATSPLIRIGLKLSKQPSRSNQHGLHSKARGPVKHGMTNAQGRRTQEYVVKACDCDEDGLFAFDLHSDGGGYRLEEKIGH